MKKKYLFLLLFVTVLNIQAQVPANDDCAHAIVIDQANFNMNEDATNATNNSGGLDVCGSPAWGMNDGVWFKLTGTGGDVNLTVVPNNWDCQVDVYSGSCGSFTCVLGLNDGTTGEQEAGMFFADSGAEYFINVGYWAYDASHPEIDNPEGPFSISVNGAILTGVHENQIDNFSIVMSRSQQMLNLTAGERIKEVIVYNLTGRQILEVQPESLQSTIDFSAISSGIYLVKVSTETQSGTYKIIK